MRKMKKEQESYPRIQSQTDELNHYKSKIKKYRNEVHELRELLESVNAKYVKASKERDRYKTKILDTKEDIARFNEIVEEKTKLQTQDIKNELVSLKKTLRKKDKQLSIKSHENEQLKNSLDEQNLYVQELEARIQELLSSKSDEESKILTPEGKSSKKKEIELINKYSPDDEEEVIITTKDTSHKKVSGMRGEVVYPSNEFMGLMQTPPTKKFKALNKVSHMSTLKPPAKNGIRSSLPAWLRETSYFDNQDQCRILLADKQGGTYEKQHEHKLKEADDPSFGDCDVNIDTDYDF